jgi:hypothetical protein
VIAAALVSVLVVGIVVAFLTRPTQSAGTASTGGASPSSVSPSSAAPSGASQRPSTTAAPAATGALLTDDFSAKAHGWTVIGDAPVRGTYSGGAYRVAVQPANTDGGAVAYPEAVRSVFPVAPADVRVDVDVRRLPQSDLATDFGLLCRGNKASDTAYLFTIGDGYASIAKAAATYRQLRKASPPIDAAAVNHLRVECTSQPGGTVHLALWVNNSLAVQAVDKQPTLGSGAVGLFVGISSLARSAVQVEFDNLRIARA